MTTALATTNPGQATLAAHSFEPGSVQDALNLAEILVASKLLPRSLNSAQAAFTVIMAGRELGLTAMQSIRSLHVIEGKPVMSADLMVALCLRDPACEYFRVVETTDSVATYETKRRGNDKPTRLSFTIEQAKAAGLVGKDNWRKFPSNMLRARCSSALARMVYADLMLGIYDTDELSNGGGRVPEQVVAEVIQDETFEPVEHPNTKLAAETVAAFEAATTLEELKAARAKVKGEKFAREDSDALKATYDRISAAFAKPETTEAAA